MAPISPSPSVPPTSDIPTNANANNVNVTTSTRTTLSWTSTPPAVLAHAMLSKKSPPKVPQRTADAATTNARSVRRKLEKVFRSRRPQPANAKKHGQAKRTQSPQPSHPLPELPPELWILILEYSTYPSSPGGEITAYAPEPSVELPSSFLSTALTPASLAPRLAHYRASMRHKRNLTLVSKQWHQYAQPVLYSFVWLARAAQAKALALTLLCQACCLDPASGPATDTSAGRFIRRLHIETPALERCNPADLRAVLAYAPALEVYSDYRSVRRGALSADLLGALAQGGALRGLSWTNYDDPALVGLGVGLGMGVGVGLGHMGGRLEYLELNFVSSAEGPAKAHFDLAMGGAGAEALSLPALKTLKVALDNATFAVLSTWDLPALRNLSVLSADFSYASAGFRRFFAVHGARLRQLELGHSSAHIEEHYLTAPPPTAAGANGGGAAHGLSLAEWCPHLEEFVCSADAAWDWQHPDWIAPHLLLPAHPTVTLIGIRGIDARLWDGDAAFFGLRAQVESLLRREAFPRLRYVRDLSAGSDALRRGRGGMRVVKFWEGVLERCRREQVWLEDWRGWNVTSGSLRRARARVAAGEVA